VHGFLGLRVPKAWCNSIMAHKEVYANADVVTHTDLEIGSSKATIVASGSE
jgi:hypothetical protein